MTTKISLLLERLDDEGSILLGLFLAISLFLESLPFFLVRSCSVVLSRRSIFPFLDASPLLFFSFLITTPPSFLAATTLSTIHYTSPLPWFHLFSTSSTVELETLVFSPSRSRRVLFFVGRSCHLFYTKLCSSSFSPVGFFERWVLRVSQFSQTLRKRD